MSPWWYVVLIVVIFVLVWWWLRKGNGGVQEKEDKISPDYIRSSEGMIESERR